MLKLNTYIERYDVQYQNYFIENHLEVIIIVTRHNTTWSTSIFKYLRVICVNQMFDKHFCSNRVMLV